MDTELGIRSHVRTKPRNSRVTQKQMADAVPKEAPLFGDTISCMKNPKS